MSFIHADIFFFISTVALVVISLAVLVLVIFLIKLVWELKELSRALREKADDLWQDWKNLEDHLTQRFGILKVLKKLAGRFMK